MIDILGYFSFLFKSNNKPSVSENISPVHRVALSPKERLNVKLDVIKTKSGRLKVSRDSFDRRYLPVMSEEQFFKDEDANGYIAISQKQLKELDKKLQKYANI